MRRARGTARPTGQRPDVDPQPPRPPTGPAAARGPRRRRPVTAGGAPPRAGRPPAPEGPADARRPPPRRPPPRDAGQSPPPPLQPSHTRCGRPRRTPSSRPSPSAGGTPTRTRVPGHPPPPHTPPPRAEGRGSDGELGAKRAGDTRQRYGRGENRAGEPDRRPREAWGVGDGAGESPEARKAWGGEAPGDRRGRPRAADGRPAGDRPRQTGPGPATGGGGARQAAPRRGAAARHAAQPARRDRRIRAARIRGLCGGRQSWPAPRAKGAWGGVGAWGACGANPLTTPPPNPRGQPRGTWRGGPGYREEGTHAGGRRHRATGQGGGAPPAGWGGTEARRGRRREEGRGRASRRRRTRLFPPDIPTTLPRRPPTSLARLLAPQTHRGVAPDRPPAARGGRGALRTRLALPLSPPPGPIPRRTGGGEAREPGAGRGEAPAPLSEPTALMILPQVHLRKPCYDFYFL